MKKLLITIASLMLFASPVVAQRHSGMARGHGEIHAPRGEVRGRVEIQAGRRDRELHNRWRGGHFDHRWFASNFGIRHPIFWRRCPWVGQPFVVGSRFFFDDVWFIIEEPIPDFWWDDGVYIDEFGDVYYICNPRFPGARFAVAVVF